jgi:hypothetical protein
MTFSFTRLNLCFASLASTLLLSSLIAPKPAHAILWFVSPGTQADSSIPISGDFTIVDELAAFPMMLSSTVTVQGLVFTAGDALISNTPGVGITAIDWQDSGQNLLSFVFTTPLTPTAGTVALDSVASTYTPFVVGTPYSVTGSVTPVPAPFPLLGAVAAVGCSRKLRRRIATMAKSNEKNATSTSGGS